MEVFISHASGDRPFVERLKDALSKRGLAVFTDADIRPGQSWSEEIRNAIARADVFIPILSTAAEANPSVLTEISLAVASDMTGGDKIIIPVRADSKAQAPFFLRDIQWADLSNERRFDRGVDILVDSIRSRQHRPSQRDGSLQTRQDFIRVQSQLLNAEMKALEEQAYRRTRFLAWMLIVVCVTVALATGAAFTTELITADDWHRHLWAAMSFVAGAVLSWTLSRSTAPKRSIREPELLEGARHE